LFIRILVSAALLLTLILSAHAAREYTPDQLRQMVAAGRYPPQGDPSEENRQVSFPECKASVRNTMAAVQPHYPVRTLEDAPARLSMKMWTKDAAVVMSCSHDDRLVIHNFSYR
jgi:hypothetical protein